jgi:hypothetical protein
VTNAQRFALPALGRAAERRPTGKRIRRRKMLGIAPESPASGARFVGQNGFSKSTAIKKTLFFCFYELCNCILQFVLIHIQFFAGD